MRHRVALVPYEVYGKAYVFWECDCGRQGTVESDEDVRLGAGAHVPGGAEVVFIRRAEELDG